MKPLVSIVLPTYNGGKYIMKSIKSVIDQSFADWELIIVNDGSNDNTKTIVNDLLVKEKRIIYIENTLNLGIQKSLNIGLKAAQGKYIARIDDDDCWINSDKLVKQVDFLERNKDFILVGTGVVVRDQKGKEMYKYLPPTTDTEIRRKILKKNCFAHSTVLFNKDIVLDNGGYDESDEVKHIEDYALWLKLGLLGKFANINEYSMFFTFRPDSLTEINNIIQAERSLKLIYKYRGKYKNFVMGYMVGSLRLLYFYFLRILPSIAKIAYIFKRFYKS